MSPIQATYKPPAETFFRGLPPGVAGCPIDGEDGVGDALRDHP